MYLREAFQKKTQQCATMSRQLAFYVDRGDVKGIKEALEKLNSHLEDLESLVEREPITPNEINNLKR